MAIKKKHKVLSLFANIGVAEALLNGICDVVLANELIPRRAKLYHQIYPECEMICGDITDHLIFDKIVSLSKKMGVEIVMATPPCQGMSTVGPQNAGDERNYLIIPVIELVKKLSPKYVVIENVPNFVNTRITYDGREQLIVDIIKSELQDMYHITVDIINTADYGVPQSRDRMILLMTKKDINKIWSIPQKEKHIVNLEEAIGWIPSIDPFVKDLPKEEFKKLFPLYEERRKKALEISIWNIPPVHIYRQVLAMQHTPTGKSAFDNEDKYKPIKADGSFVKGYHNTYSRQRWDTPAFTITMDNRKISSQGNVHPGRLIGKDSDGTKLYSDARALTLFELMLVMSLPQDWPLPKETEEAFVRRIIGEGIPPLFIKKLFKNIPS